MIYPLPLKATSRIQVPASASPVRREFFDPGLNRLQRWGYVPLSSPAAYTTHFYSAGPDDDRAAELIRAIEADEIDGIWCARGGYGSGRLLPYLDRHFATPPATCKTLIGCSDITYVLVYALQRWDWVVFHGPMVAGDLGRDTTHFDESYLLSLLRGQASRREVSPDPLDVLLDGPAVTARLTGGCLSVLCATLGTPYEWETSGRILLLEDTQVKPYQLDRMLTQLRQAGKFDDCAGVVFGQMPDCRQHPDQGYTLGDAIRHALAGLACPVLFGLPTGHTLGATVPVALGARYRLDPGAHNLILEDSELCPC